MARVLKPFSSVLKVQSRFLIYLPYFTNQEKKKRNIWLCMSIIGRLLSYLGCAIPSLFHILYIKKENIKIDISENYNVLIGGLFVTMADLIFPFFSNKWTILLNKITDYKSLGKPTNTKKTIKYRVHPHQTIKSCNKAFTFFKNFIIIGSLFYTFVTFFEIKYCLIIKKKLQKNMFCISFLPFWLPMEINLQTQLIVFPLQYIFMSFCIMPGFIGFLIWETSAMLSLHFEQLTVTIKQIIEIKDMDIRKESIKLWLFYHLHVFRLIKDYNFLTKACFGIYTMLGSISLAFIMNQILSKNKPLGAAVHLLGWLITLYFYCDAGQKIEEGSLSISLAIYNTSWYNMDLKTQKDLLFILHRCQKPVNLDALPVGVLGSQLMLTILKTAYSYLTLLTNTSYRSS